MAHHKNRNERESRPIDDTAADTASDRTLLPMLVGGLVLVVVGAIIVMTFV